MNYLKKFFMHGLSKKVIYAVIVLAAIDMFSMAAPYYLKYVIPDVYKYLHVNQADFDQLNAVLGYVVLAFQIPSGIIADKMSGKKLLIISVVMSGILTVIFGLAAQQVFPSQIALPIMYFVFVGFGISTTLFLWSPLWKVLSDQSKKEDQASLYGLQGTYNGIFGLVFITLIGTLATYFSNLGNNILFYILIYIVAASLFISAIGVHFFVKESNYKSFLSLKFSEMVKKIKNFKFTRKNFGSLLILRVWLIAFFVLGMYMFQSIFAYYLKSYISLILPAALVTVLAGFRTYGLRTLVSSPFGKWMKKRSSWVFTLAMILTLGILTAILLILLGGIGNVINTFSPSYLLFLEIVLPILFILVGVASWFLVAGRYMQIEEIPHTQNNYGTIIALISFVAFSSDSWFYQMASSWMKHGNYIDNDGGYTQEGLQLILLVAVSISIFGVFCGIGAFLINKHEMKKLNKTTYRWRNWQTETKTEIKTKN